MAADRINWHEIQISTLLLFTMTLLELCSTKSNAWGGNKETTCPAANNKIISAADALREAIQVAERAKVRAGVTHKIGEKKAKAKQLQFETPQDGLAPTPKPPSSPPSKPNEPHYVWKTSTPRTTEEVLSDIANTNRYSNPNTIPPFSVEEIIKKPDFAYLDMGAGPTLVTMELRKKRIKAGRRAHNIMAFDFDYTNDAQGLRARLEKLGNSKHDEALKKAIPELLKDMEKNSRNYRGGTFQNMDIMVNAADKFGNLTRERMLFDLISSNQSSNWVFSNSSSAEREMVLQRILLHLKDNGVFRGSGLLELDAEGWLAKRLEKLKKDGQIVDYVVTNNAIVFRKR